MAGSRLTAGGDAVGRALYLRMCVGRGEEHSRGFQVGGKGAQPGMAVPRNPGKSSIASPSRARESAFAVPPGLAILCVGIVPSTSYWAKVFGVPLGLAWRKFRSSRPSGTQYLRMCVVNAVGNIQGASTRAEKRTARNGCATYPALRTGLKSSASLWDSPGVAKIQIESYLRDSLCLRMCVVEAVGNIQGASTRAEKRTARNGCATYPALRAGLKSSASPWDWRGETSD